MASAAEVSLEALRAACEPGKRWSDTALRDAPQELILPLTDVALAARRVLAVLDTYNEGRFAECDDLREALIGFV